jgi:hypothetical protein
MTKLELDISFRGIILFLALLRGPWVESILEIYGFFYYYSTLQRGGIAC